jgi:uncharacterized membrane-anchored protein
MELKYNNHHGWMIIPHPLMESIPQHQPKQSELNRSLVPPLVVRPVEPRKKIRGSYLSAGYSYASIDNDRFLSCDNYRYRIPRQRKGTACGTVRGGAARATSSGRAHDRAESTVCC